MKKILELNKKLNDTYIPVGRAGEEGVARQAEADTANCGLSNGAFAGRVAAKAQAHDKQERLRQQFLGFGRRLQEGQRCNRRRARRLPCRPPCATCRLKKREAHVKQLLADREAIQKELIQLLLAQREGRLSPPRNKKSWRRGKSRTTPSARRCSARWTNR